MVKKINRLATGWKKKGSAFTYDKRLMFRMYKEFYLNKGKKLINGPKFEQTVHKGKYTDGPYEH